MAYESPEVELIEIHVESCFAQSGTHIDDLTEEDLEW